MPAVESTMVPIGSPAPAFSLPNFGIDADGAYGTGTPVSLRDDLTDPKIVVVMFLCNHCPFVMHLADHIAALANEFAEMPVGFVAISSNDASAYPADGPERMAQEARARGYRFPYLYDETQEVATLYRAACTPDFFVFDGGRKLVYRGQYDDSRPGNGIPVSGDDLRAAIEAALWDKPILDPQKPSIGCSIKWTPGNKPDYVG